MTLVLLTGASGYIAKHIAVELLNSGFEVRASVRSLSRTSEVVEAVTPHLLDKTGLVSRLTFVELDLLDDQGWAAALTGVDALLHTASPFPLVQPKSEGDLIRPAVDGTRRALTAASNAGVTRVVLTSSIAAIYGGQTAGLELNEELWTDVNRPRVDAYTKSKTLAEKAAWEMAQTHGLQLTTINPGVVVGTPLDNNFGSSISIIERLLNRKDPVLPKLTFAYVDVKDVARMHVAALENSATIGQRYLATSNSLSFLEVANAMKSAFPGRKFVTRVAPNFLIKFVGIFDKTVRTTFPFLGKPMITANAKAEKAFNFKFRPAREAIIESAKFLIDNKLVKK
jgi:dihydroflavonol-4-reductase